MRAFQTTPANFSPLKSNSKSQTKVKSAHERSRLEPTDLANFVDLSLEKTLRTKDDFSPIKKLGTGAFGNVFLVQDAMKKCYAMKVIPKSRLKNPKEKETGREMILT